MACWINTYLIKEGETMLLESTRAGSLIHVPTGYDSFLPKSLPPEPEVAIDSEMQLLLSEADRKLGRLDGITEILPNPELFVSMYVRKEAVLSSQIEGTQASMVDVLDTEDKEGKSDIRDVVNYVDAMDYGLERLKELPLSLRLLREIHSKLLRNVRGSDKNPGEFRTTQNWIGTPGCTLAEASFVPPPPDDMLQAMNELESYFYDSRIIPPLIKIALIHAQFETIHPFLDGNGRMGRLLITFWLCEQKVLQQPLLYLSYYFKKNRLEYYDRLMAVRLKGDWEGWIKFFLKGVIETSDEATESAKQILNLQKQYSDLIQEKGYNINHQRVLEYLFEQPFPDKTAASKALNISFPTVSTIIENFCDDGILIDLTPEKSRYKKYRFEEYVNILNKGTEI